MARAWIVVALVLAFAATVWAEPRARYQIASRPHVDVPFDIALVIEGFEEAPAPEQPKLEIAGATVTARGVTPSVSRSISIVNGRRTDATVVTWTMSWRVVVKSPGQIRVPSVTVKQGDRSATAQSGALGVEAVPTTDEMKLQLVVPDRTIYVGETVPVTLEWLFRVEPSSPTLTVPFANLDELTLSTPSVPQGSRQVIELEMGGKPVQVPYELDEVERDGQRFNRLTVTLFAAPKQPGKIDIPPARVTAELRVGRPDFFGNAPTRLFRATDTARVLTVKPLPETDRPPTFAGAVGEQFAIEVRTSRSVVSLGEPVELDVTIKSDQRLDTLGLGKLEGPGRLPKDKFTVSAEAPTGELSSDGKSKRFQVIAQVIGAATEIPALAFSYFDPRKGTYQTIHSEPIALSVKGGSIVDASSVVASRASEQPDAEVRIDVAAELALSAPGAIDDRPLGGPLLWLVVAALYALPLGFFAFRTWQLRTAGSREEASEVRTARRKVEDLLDRAREAPAREVAGPLVAALRELARSSGRAIDDDGLLARLETEAFAPDAAGKPLSPDLRSDAAGLLRRWTAEARRVRGKASAAVLLALVTSGVSTAEAAALDDGRVAYQLAMEQTSDPTARKATFARAAKALGEAARERPGRPELLTDWGNAALGAGDVATATLAYRRALAIDGGTTRARRNLAFLRGRLPESLRPVVREGATDTLLFFHRWPRAQRLLVGGAAFALAVLLVVPWGGRRRATLRGLAVIPLLAWLVMLGSVVLETRATDDAIVMDGVVLRAADSAGAPATLPQPLPRGTEVVIREEREAWTRIELADNTAGWVPSSAVERVLHRD